MRGGSTQFWEKKFAGRFVLYTRVLTVGFKRKSILGAWGQGAKVHTGVWVTPTAGGGAEAIEKKSPLYA